MGGPALRIVRREEGFEKRDRVSFSAGAIEHFDRIAEDYTRWRRKMTYHVGHTIEFLKGVVPPGKRVLLVGAPSWEILDALQPEEGLGLDISPKLVEIARARNRNPRVSFHAALPESYEPSRPYDYVILINQTDYAHDLMVLVQSLRRFCHPETRVILSMLNPAWHSAVRLTSALRIRIPDYRRNLVSMEMLGTILQVKGFRLMGDYRRILFPRHIPGLSRMLNTYAARLPGLNSLCFIEYLIAKPFSSERETRPSCSVIIPCYNEESNVEECALRVPRMGELTEVILVNDGSKDRTAEIGRALSLRHPHIRLITYEKNRGKGAAVLEGIRQAKGDIVMILDADMTVPPEELVDFYEAIASGVAEFVSGTRFLYPMEDEAMRLANFFGNILFSKLVQVIVGSPCSDTLCGTKVMRREDFKNLEIEDSSWGDFDFIFHASRLKLKSVQIPVHYKSRVGGVSKMKALRSGIRFLSLCMKKWKEVP